MVAEPGRRAVRSITTAGNALRASLMGALDEDEEYDERELVLIELAAHQADEIEQLEQLLKSQGAIVEGSQGQPRLSPIFTELRQQRLALERILSAVRLPDEGLGASKNVTKVRAARASWRGV